MTFQTQLTLNVKKFFLEPRGSAVGRTGPLPMPRELHCGAVAGLERVDWSVDGRLEVLVGWSRGGGG